MYPPCEKNGACIDDGCTEEVGSSCDCSCHNLFSVSPVVEITREEAERLYSSNPDACSEVSNWQIQGLLSEMG